MDGIMISAILPILYCCHYTGHHWRFPLLVHITGDPWVTWAWPAPNLPKTHTQTLEYGYCSQVLQVQGLYYSLFLSIYYILYTRCLKHALLPSPLLLHTSSPSPLHAHSPLPLHTPLPLLHMHLLTSKNASTCEGVEGVHVRLSAVSIAHVWGAHEGIDSIDSIAHIWGVSTASITCVWGHRGCQHHAFGGHAWGYQ